MQHHVPPNDLIEYLEQKFVHPAATATPTRTPDVSFFLDRDGTISQVQGARYMQNGDSIHTYIFFQDLPKFIEAMNSDRQFCIIHNRFPCSGQIEHFIYRLDSTREKGGAPWRVLLWK